MPLLWICPLILFFKKGYNADMDTNQLIWTEEQRTTVFTCPIFSIQEIRSRAPEGNTGTFMVLKSWDWAIIIPVLNRTHFVMVRQWRHGSQELSLEFPGGVFNPGEDAATAGARELHEETGYYAGTITCLGQFNPNPAIMTNHVHIFLAEDLHNSGHQELDADEYLAMEIVPIKDVIAGMGKPPYVHALMGSALGLYLRR
jgi:8-oxo-dGTP pyrophosphatase MutT (NUDIX family)